MFLYLSLIALVGLILTVFAYLINITAYSLNVIFLLVFNSIVIEFVIDGIFAFLVHILPNNMFEIDNKLYAVSNKERNFYEKIKIRKWKDKVWELGGLGGFSKKKLKSRADKKYFEQFIIESNKGVMTHILGCIFGFLIILFFPEDIIVCITLPIAILNVLFNLPSLFILRYNTPKLLAYYKRLVRNDANKNLSYKEEDDSQNETTTIKI